MRIIVTGATGNIGTSLLRSLVRRPEAEDIVGIARRLPDLTFPKTTFVAADIASADLDEVLRGADAVVHLAWQIQPSHRPEELAKTNILGSQRLFEAVARSRVRVLVVASSVAAYSPGPRDKLVDESWPTQGIPSSLYSRHKVALERMLDDLEQIGPDLRIVRMRPALAFKREAGSEIRRLFMGRLAPRWLFHPRVLKLVPANPDLAFQCVHSHDVGDAFARAVVGNARGAFNLAATPTIDSNRLASILAARPCDLSRNTLHRLVDATWKVHLQPADPGWVDLAFESPLMSFERARKELDWEPRHSAAAALRQLIQGLRMANGMETPPLASPAHVETSA